MMAGLLLAIGLAIGLVGGTVAVAAAAVSRAELSRWVSNRLRGAAVASRLYDAPASMWQAANAVASIGIVVAGLGFGYWIARVTAPIGAVTLIFAGLPVATVLGYGIPRAIGRRWSESVVDRAGPLTRMLKLATPLVGPGPDGPTGLAAGVEARAPSSPDANDQARMISGVLAFTERQVRDAMTPRTAVIGLEEGAALADIARAFMESGYSRIPVFRDNLDNVVGMIHAFDLLKVTPGSELPLRPLKQSPGSSTCASLLFEMQRDRCHLAVVLDEYGGTAGIVTIEDLLEELVGEIFDDDEVRDAADELPILEIDGSAPTEELGAHFGIPLSNGAETVGGLLAHLAGRIPQAGEHLRYGSLEFDVLEATPVRVERLVVRRGPLRLTTIRDR